MAVNVATLTAKLEADIRDFDRDMKTASKRIDKLEAGTKKASKGMGGMSSAAAKLGAALSAAAIAKGIANVTKMAVDAEEAGSAFKTVFGPSVESAGRFVEEFANKAGFAEYELEQLLATTGNIVQGIGATETESAALSETMARLAGDVASFSNAAGGAPAVLGALQSALTGEREALKTYGIVISEADVQQRALANSGKSAASELTKLEKATATVELATERAGKAVGDLDRTSDGAANSMRTLTAMWEEAQTEIGQNLLPILEDLIPILQDNLPGAAATLTTAVDVFVDTVTFARMAWAGFAEALGFGTKGFKDQIIVTQTLRDRIREGGDAATELASAYWTLGKRTDLTEDNVKALTKASKASNAEIEEALRRTVNYALAQGEVTESTQVLKDELYEVSLANRESSYAAAAAELGLEALGIQSNATYEATALLNRELAERATADRYATALFLIRDAASDAAAKLRGLWLETLAGTSPTFRAIREWETYQEMLKEGAGGIPLLEQEISTFAAVGALGGTLEEQAYAISQATGRSIESIITELEKAGLDDAMNNAAEAAQLFADRINMIVFPGLPTFTPEDFADVPELELGPVPPFQVAQSRHHVLAGKFDSGGIVPGPIGSPQLAVVHGGETILPTHKDESDTGANITINVTESYNDPAAARRLVRELADELESYYRETVR
jgi:hypothetical protein